ncbi:all trans-polyprenyl-diphosphate synthase PDSS1 isoform X6 [Dermacentor andersoni]|uniref:all trans-polyprenyl-diphosphate synthase PDSS1 isoform X6 n=1 Tax=Dermacentor andersoni TaxID=34620 RepID=UPI0021556583|nr:all trans-polyprenyl-diphosphate synthase PDSS1-like isoform X6 [Dermacentor andersoni]
MAAGSARKLTAFVDKLGNCTKCLRLPRLSSHSVRWQHASWFALRQDRRLQHPLGGSGQGTRASCCSCRHGTTTAPAQFTPRRTFVTTAPWSQAPLVQQPGSLPETSTDPFELSKQDLADIYDAIKKELWVSKPQLNEIASYYFDGQGKAFRPMICTLMARAVNIHVHNRNVLLDFQKKVALLCEMIHTASLVHDDVIDTSDTRRGKPSVNVLWGQKKAILAGDFVLSRTAQLLAKIGSNDVNSFLSQVLVDLVQGEFMQLGSKEDEGERFSHYIQKTFKKTASLIAFACRSVSILGGGDEKIQEAAYQYGRNVGIAFQLVDDLLDFVSSQSDLGKPAAADLRLGLATAPVLFACDKYPELNAMIMRRFSEPGDVERAYEAVLKSDGLEHTRLLAQKHCSEAVRHLAPWVESPEKQALISITEKVLNRKK